MSQTERNEVVDIILCNVAMLFIPPPVVEIPGLILHRRFSPCEITPQRLFVINYRRKKKKKKLEQ